jgi:hypothetical protein
MGWVDASGYHKGNPPIEKLVNRQNSTYKQHDHKRQRQDYAREIIQPYKNGKPNDDFIQAYPVEAKEYGFIKEVKD